MSLDSNISEQNLLASGQQTLQQEDTQQRLAANVFRGVSILDHAQPT